MVTRKVIGIEIPDERVIFIVVQWVIRPDEVREPSNSSKRHGFSSCFKFSGETREESMKLSEAPESTSAKWESVESKVTSRSSEEEELKVARRVANSYRSSSQGEGDRSRSCESSGWSKGFPTPLVLSPLPR